MLPPRLKDADEEFVKRLREGDKEAQKMAIEGMLRYAFKIAKNMSLKRPEFSNDLIGEAYLEVVIAIKRIADGGMKNHDNLKGYIGSCIRGKLMRFLSEQSGFGRIPQSSFKRKRLSHGTRMEAIDIGVIDFNIISDEFVEFVKSLTDNELEKEIIQLRYQGLTDQEVAQKVGMSRTYVLKVRTRLERCYYEHEGIVVGKVQECPQGTPSEGGGISDQDREADQVSLRAAAVQT